MTRFFHITLAAIYILITIIALLVTLSIAGLHISDRNAIIAILAWSVVCGLSAWVRTEWYLFFTSACRKPTAQEKLRLEKCFAEVRLAAASNINCRLLIEESDCISAFAIGPGTIVISSMTMKTMTDDQLLGIMAHEFGHIVSKDPVIASAMSTAAALPQAVAFLYRWAAKITLTVLDIAMRIIGKISFVLQILMMILLGWAILQYRLIAPVIAIILFVLLFTILNRIVRFLALAISRYTEYKQDAFARRLGYGPQLRDVLILLAGSTGTAPASTYQTLMNGTHPIIHNRIRKLENY